MGFPRLVLVADRFCAEGVGERVVAAVGAGVRWVQLRDHAAEADVFAGAAGVLVDRMRAVAPDVRVSINTHIDVAAALGAGLHVGRRGPSVAEARRVLGDGVWIGFSAHDAGGARRAVEQGADYLFLSPIFPTRSKPGEPGRGTAVLRAVRAVVPDTPVYALGGVTPGRVADCLAAGAFGVAVLSGILAAPDPGRAARTYLEALRPNTSTS